MMMLNKDLRRKYVVEMKIIKKRVCGEKARYFSA